MVAAEGVGEGNGVRHEGADDLYGSPEHDCDLVMKGGVTSGVIYPLAICRLAEQYRFHCIGGASAGAIAAAAAAAAEYARRKNAAGPGAGFRGLEALPGRITETVGERSRLLSLFQASAGTKDALDGLLVGISSDGVMRKVLRGIKLVCTRRQLFPRIAIIAAAVMLVEAAVGTAGVVGSVGLVLGALLAIAAGIALAAVVAVVSSLKAVQANSGGICSGYAEEHPPGAPPLCTWLADVIDELAGRSPTPTSKPLLFGDLQGATIEDHPEGIGLVMMTTNLTHGRPYRLPLEGTAFVFRRSEMEKLFPPRVVEAMVEGAKRTRARVDPLVAAHRAAGGNGRPGRNAARSAGEKAQSALSPEMNELTVLVGLLDDDELPADEYYLFPDPAHLPVIVATRMSLSFPVLLSAVPMYAVNWARVQDDSAEPALERCWFSDGGICSNLPIHFFDVLLPTRPTFALNLEVRPDSDVVLVPPAEHEEEERNIRLARDSGQGLSERWAPIGKPDGSLPIHHLFGSIVETMQSWNDNMQISVPGYRDRVVHILHRNDEGGLNLSMPVPVIERLSRRGHFAGKALVDRFTEDGLQGGWPNHLWIRYRSALAMLEELFTGAYTRYFVVPERIKLLVKLLETPPSYPFDRQEDADLARRINREFAQVGSELATARPNLRAGRPIPPPELRARPHGS